MNLILRTTAILVAVALSAIALASVLLPRQLPLDVPVSERGPLTTSPLPVADRTSGPSLIERSPFARDRSMFARNAGPPPPELEVKLAGIFKVGKETRASLMIGGQTLIVQKGDETPIGVVVAIEPSAVVLEGASPRRIELFKQ